MFACLSAALHTRRETVKQRETEVKQRETEVEGERKGRREGLRTGNKNYCRYVAAARVPNPQARGFPPHTIFVDAIAVGVPKGDVDAEEKLKRSRGG